MSDWNFAASFTRTADDILQVRKIIADQKKDHVAIIAKIENQEGVNNIDEILKVADGVMVARGDMGVEIPLEEVPVIQKMIIEKAKTFVNVPVVFTADMNVIEGSENYKQFVNSDYFSDTKYLAPDTMSYCTYHDTEPEKHAEDVIDYVMINKYFKALTYKVLTEGIDGRFVSDHYPIYADLEFNV